MDLITGVIKKSIIIVLPAVALSAFLIEYPRVPLGIFMGWLLGVFNFRGLARNVRGLAAADRAAMKMLFFNMSRLMVVFVAIFLLVYYGVVNIFGLLFGFTVVFFCILFEGMRAGKPL